MDHETAVTVLQSFAGPQQTYENGANVTGTSEPVRIGWIGVGRMGYEMCRRLLDAGYNLTVWNRTASKTEPLVEQGATLAGTPADLATCDVVFTMVAASEDFKEVTIGPDGVLSRPGTAPRVLIDSSTVSAEASGVVRARGLEVGTELLAAPVSGNPKVVAAGRLTLVVSGPETAWQLAAPILAALGDGATYVGEGDAARLVKICHNVMLGVVAQCLAEITVLAEKGGVSRKDFLAFLNQSVLGSTFTRYKTPAFVELDYTPTFTPELLRKDFDLGLTAASELGVEMPVAELVHSLVGKIVEAGLTDVDFAVMLQVQAEASGLELEPEPGPVPTGLEAGSVAA
jgi:3-hydroxyisobutyrate dehydrogenase